MSVLVCGESASGVQQLYLIIVSAATGSLALSINATLLASDALGVDLASVTHVEQLQSQTAVVLGDVAMKKVSLLVHHANKIEQFEVELTLRTDNSPVKKPTNKLAKKSRSTLFEDNGEISVLKVTAGAVYVKTSKGLVQVRLADDQKSEETASQKSSTGATLASETEASDVAFDAENLTIKHLEAYEELMKGIAVPSQSNSSDKSQSLRRKHNWVAGAADKNGMGPLDVKFENAANLISLNFDLTFSCNDFKKLQEQLNSDQGADVVEKKSEDKKDEAVKERVSEEQKKLGQFSLKNNAVTVPDDRAAAASVAKKEGEPESVNYLPLLVHSHRGAQFSNVLPVANLLQDNADAFASNYPRPEVYMRHAHNECMNIEKITLRSRQ